MGDKTPMPRSTGCRGNINNPVYGAHSSNADAALHYTRYHLIWHGSEQESQASHWVHQTSTEHGVTLIDKKVLGFHVIIPKYPDLGTRLRSISPATSAGPASAVHRSEIVQSKYSVLLQTPRIIITIIIYKQKVTQYSHDQSAISSTPERKQNCNIQSAIIVNLELHRYSTEIPKNRIIK